MAKFKVTVRRSEYRCMSFDVTVDTEGKTEWDITQEVIIKAHKTARDTEFARGDDVEYDVTDIKEEK